MTLNQLLEVNHEGFKNAFGFTTLVIDIEDVEDEHYSIDMILKENDFEIMASHDTKEVHIIETNMPFKFYQNVYPEMV